MNSYWRLGPAETPQPKAGGAESLIPGEVVMTYVGQKGELLAALSRACLFPVANETVRMDTSAGKAVATFPVRGVVDSQEFKQRATWFTADPGEWERASPVDRRAAVANLSVVPRLVLHYRLAPLPSGKASSHQPRRRRVDYEDGRYAIITDGDAKRIDFNTGESVTVTELEEPDLKPLPEHKRTRRAYLAPTNFRLEVFDAEGMKVGLNGQRYRPWDAMPPDAYGPATVVSR